MSNNDPQHRPDLAGDLPDLETCPTQVTPAAKRVTATVPTAAKTHVFEAGTQIAGRYRILDVLGVGGMGVVYRAYDEMLDVEIALKALRSDIAIDSDFVQRFHNELLLARKVSHRHVVSNYDVGEYQGMHYMTMDLVVGRSLDDVLREKGKLPLDEAVRIIRQVADALAEAHRQGIVHRDLKPANILLDGTGDAYVTDFGIARTLGSGMTRTGEILGTPDYLSPEQARGEKVDGRSDIFTLGLIFVQVLTGKLPFPGGTLLEIVAQRMAGKIQDLDELGLEAPPEVVQVIRRAIETDPDKRFQTADEINRSLDKPQQQRSAALSRRSLALVGLLAAVGLAAFFLGRVAPPEVLPGAGTTAPEATTPEAGAPEAAPELPAPRPRHSVAVLPFPVAGENPQLAWASSGVAEMLATAVAENKDVRVVGSVRVFQILQDLGFEPDRLRQDELEQLAGLLAVDRLVFGVVRSVDRQIQLEMSLMKTDLPGAPTELVETSRGDLRQLFDLTDQLAARLRETLQIEDRDAVESVLTTSAPALEAYSEGLQYLSRRESLKAAPALAEAVAADPAFAIAWVRLSQALSDLGRLDEATAAARKAVLAVGDGGGRIAYEAQAQEALLEGDPKKAQRFLEQLVQNFPNDIGARVGLAEAYGHEGRFSDAAAVLKEVVAVDTGDARAWYLLGRYSIRGGDIQTAVAEYLPQALIRQRALRNEQGEAEVYNALGAGYEFLGQPGEAEKNYQAAAEIRQRIGDRRGLATTLTNLSRVNLSSGDVETAGTNLENALEIHRELGNRAGVAEIYNAFGGMEEIRGRYAEALEYFRQALQERTHLGNERALAESHGNVGYLYFLLGEYDNALLYLEKGLGLYQKNEDARGTMLTLQSVGTCQLALGRWDESLDAFLKSLDLSRELGQKLATAVAHGNLGRLAQFQGRYRAAFASFKDALAIVTEVGETRGQAEIALHEAEALLELGELAAAELKLEKVGSIMGSGAIEEHQARLLALRGELALRRGDREGAARLFEQAGEQARVSSSAVIELQARIGSARAAGRAADSAAALASLRTAHDEAEKLGHAVLRLSASEALAPAELAAGNAERAEEILRRALRLADDGGAYARAFHLHDLLAGLLEARGDAAGTREQLSRAHEELGRVRHHLDADMLVVFEELPEVRDLLATN